jgi:hypothetical protein
MKKSLNALGVTFASTLALTLAAYAQQEGTTPLAEQPGAQPQVQEQAQPQTVQSRCLESLNQLAQRMNEDGYGLAGYTNYGGGFGNRPVADGPAARPLTGATPSPGAGPTADPTRPTTTVSPWTNVGWGVRPHYEIRTLFLAAHVLGNNGNEDACMTVLGAAEQRYDGYVNRLRELGLEPQEITDWRQAEIAAAVPVAETSFPRRVEDMIGADVRNVQDEDLGDVEDVVLNPRNGGVQYVIVSRGGFFGIGSKEVAVPWEHLWVAPGMSTFVLPIDVAAMEQAPQVPQDNLVDPGQTGAIQQNEVETYWRNTLNQ